MSQRLPLADIQFISDFAVFARSKGDEKYTFTDNRSCACAQFLLASGRADEPLVWMECWFDDAGARRELPELVQTAIYGVSGTWDDYVNDKVKDGPRTFSALADRLEALIADAPVVSK
jgi:hypothetical protein